MIYKAKDGKEFNNEIEALNYEKQLNLDEIKINILPKIKENWTDNKLLYIKLILSQHRTKLKKSSLDEILIKAVYYKHLIVNEIINLEFSDKDIINFLISQSLINGRFPEKYLKSSEQLFIFKLFVNFIEEKLSSTDLLDNWRKTALFNILEKWMFDELLSFYFKIKSNFPDNIIYTFLSDKEFTKNNVEDMLKFRVIDLEYLKQNIDTNLINFTKFPYGIKSSNYAYSGHNNWISIMDLKNNIRYQLKQSDKYDSPYFCKQTIESNYSHNFNFYIDNEVGKQICDIIESIELPKDMTILIDKDELIKKFGDGDSRYYWHEQQYRHKLRILQINENSFKVRFAYLDDIRNSWRDKYGDSYVFELPKINFMTEVKKDDYSYVMLEKEINKICGLLHNTTFKINYLNSKTLKLKSNSTDHLK